MLEYLKGIVIELNPANMVIESGPIGWFINISLNTYSQFNGKTEIKVYVHEVIREDAHLLYGFAELSERELFRQLISVSGVGSNTAIMMLSSLSSNDLKEAILAENVSILKAVKGIGIKTAQRIIIELKDKIGKKSIGNQLFNIQSHPIREEALSALVMLGFNRKEAEKTVDRILAENPQCAVELVVKAALKQM